MAPPDSDDDPDGTRDDPPNEGSDPPSGDGRDDSAEADSDGPTGDGSGGPADDRSSADGDRTRRWLIRILVALGLGIPIAIEGLTFVGLIRSRLLGGDGEDGDGGTATPTRTRTPVATIPPEGVGVGDELLPGTRPVDTVTDAVVIPSGDVWTFSLTVDIENTGDAPYEVTLGSVWTDADERITAGNPSSGEIGPGNIGSVTGTWEIPPESEPASLQVIAVTFTEDSPETVAEQVPLASVAVRNGDGDA